MEDDVLVQKDLASSFMLDHNRKVNYVLLFWGLLKV